MLGVKQYFGLRQVNVNTAKMRTHHFGGIQVSALMATVAMTTGMMTEEMNMKILFSFSNLLLPHILCARPGIPPHLGTNPQSPQIMEYCLMPSP